jgi:two-component system NtrC family sensor kinase
MSKLKLMKRFLLTIFLITSAMLLFAQNATINRLKYRLRTATNDSVKVSILDSLSMYNMFFYHGADSTFSYCHEYINKAFQLPDKKYFILAYARLSFCYNNVTQYKETLSTALKTLNLAEQYHNQDYLSAIYYDLTWAYLNLNDNREALKNALRGISYLKRNKDPFFDQALHLYGITGLCYQNLGKGDSALFYYKKMGSLVPASKELSAKAIADWHWVIYYLFYTKQYEKADSLIADGIKECLATGDFLLDYFYIWSANSAIDQNKIDKAITQAKMGFKLSIFINDPAGESNAAGLLESCYEKINKRDSAFHYLKIEDSLNVVKQDHSNALDIQQFQFDQQLNKKEQAAASAIQEQKQRSRTLIYVFVTSVAFLLVILTIQWRNSNQKRRANEMLRQQKEKVESTLTELRSAQAQLIQREKMASLGELTAGIAHEIQNPLNFVNNFSEVNRELMGELDEELEKGDIKEAKALAAGIIENLNKITHHGKRADSIVKGMLEHSKQSTGAKELTDINKLAEEYLRLAHNGFLAKNKMFNIALVTHLEADLPMVFISGQEIGRALLNLFNNAFYAVHQKSAPTGDEYKPVVEIRTTAKMGNILITVTDNGPGIPDNIKDKIMQPFFTTKPTGEGVGLGLSLSYDIVVKGHGGSISVETKEGEFTAVIIELPVA